MRRPSTPPRAALGRLPTGSSSRIHRAGRAAKVLAAFAAGVFALSVASPGAGARSLGATRSAAGDIPAAEARLSDATAARQHAEQRLAEARAAQVAVRAELGELEAGAARITEDLAQARAELREYVVAAYIDGGASAVASTGLDPSERAEVAWHTHLVGSATADAAEAIERFNTLKAANDPARVEAAARLDEVDARVEAAFNDATQAGAHERDAEAALTSLRAAEAEARAAAARERTESDEAASTSANSAAAASSGATPAPAGGRRASPSPRSVAPAQARPAGNTGAGTSGATAHEAALLARIRHCESRGNYGIVSASGLYRGAYQFDRRTWAGVGGSGDPAAASPAEQDKRALILLRQRGTRPWPNCG